MQYFTYISHVYTLKNKLEKAVFTLLLIENRSVVDAENIDLFKSKLLENIKLLESENPRCKSLHSHFSTPHSSEKYKDFSLIIPGICSFNIYQSR
jgi:predicted Zn-dependent peptidase